MAEPRRERYGLLKIVVAVGSVVGLMVAWLGFARSSDARIAAWAAEQQLAETSVAVVFAASTTPTTSGTPATVSAPTGTPVPTSTAQSPEQAPTPRPSTARRPRVSRGS